MQQRLDHLLANTNLWKALQDNVSALVLAWRPSFAAQAPCLDVRDSSGRRECTASSCLHSVQLEGGSLPVICRMPSFWKPKRVLSRWTMQLLSLMHPFSLLLDPMSA